ncbi:hypothetical protein QE152_g40345 [Popillia japonica]|uniref:Uncharacterized protein n=1 Tax=Popillia japonica TaxID=7064 RepID=A0AAW1HS68_POPJA
MAGSSQQATQYVLTPLPDSPSSKNLFEHHTKMDVGDDCLNETLTPVSTRSPVDYGELSNAKILKHIRLLQQILAKRSGRRSSTRDLRAEFDKEGVRSDSKPAERTVTGSNNSSFEESDATSNCSIGSLVRGVLKHSETRKRHASPSNRHVEDVMVHAPLNRASSAHKSSDTGEDAVRPGTPAKRKKTNAAFQQNLDDISVINTTQSQHDSRARSRSDGPNGAYGTSQGASVPPRKPLPKYEDPAYCSSKQGAVVQCLHGNQTQGPHVHKGPECL